MLASRPDPNHVRSAMLIYQSLQKQGDLSFAALVVIANIHELLGQTAKSDEVWNQMLASTRVNLELQVIRASRLHNLGRQTMR